MEHSTEINKNTIRIQYLAKRDRLDAMLAAEADKGLSARLMEVIAATATTIAGYRPIRREADPTLAMQECARRGQKLCLPIIEAQDKPLYFRRWKMEEPLEKGRYGVEVPQASSPTAKPEVLLVPLVAFDRRGYRLGYGAGYYDRTIRALREQGRVLQAIGVAYSLQEVAELPAETFDERLDMIVTEQETVRCL